MSSTIFKKDFLEMELSNGEEYNENKFYEKNSLIFGSNGTGKSTWTSVLLNKNSFFIIDKKRFEDWMNSNEDKRNRKTSKIITIKPFSLLIKNEEEILENKIKELKNLFKDDKQLLNNIDKNLKTSFLDYICSSKTNNIEKIDSFKPIVTLEEISSFDSELDSNLNSEFIKKNISSIIQIKNLNLERENYKKIIEVEFLKISLKIVECSIDKCPICGSKVNNLREEIEEKINAINRTIKNLESDLLLKNNENGEEIVGSINRQIKTINNLNISDKKYTEYLFLRGKNFNEISKLISEIANIQSNIKDLVLRQQQSIENLKNSLKEYTNLLKERLSVDVDVDDENKEIKVKLNKTNLNSFSTGELNFLFLIIHIIEFVGSNYKYLILDDPLNSNDIIYQYNLVYFIVKIFEPFLTKKSKFITIFSHNFYLFSLFKNQMPIFIENKYFIDKIQQRKSIVYKTKLKDFSLEEFANQQNKQTNIQDIVVLKLLIQREKYNNISEIKFDNDILFLCDNPSKDKYSAISKFLHYYAEGVRAISDYGEINNVEFFEKKIKSNIFDESLSLEEKIQQKILLTLSIRFNLEKSIEMLIKKFVPTKMEDFKRNKILSNGTNILRNFLKSTDRNNLPKYDIIEEILSKISRLKVLVNENSHIRTLQYSIVCKTMDLIAELDLFNEIENIANNLIDNKN